jgi:hypothetical protein
MLELRDKVTWQWRHQSQSCFGSFALSLDSFKLIWRIKAQLEMSQIDLSRCAVDAAWRDVRQASALNSRHERLLRSSA